MSWYVYTRSAALKRLHAFPVITELQCVERHLELGTWVLRAPYQGAAVAAMLDVPDSGLLVRDDAGTVQYAGPMVSWEREVDDRGDFVTFYGHDDMDVLATRFVHPQPLSSAPPFATASHDRHTATPVEVVRRFIDRNAGPGARAARRHPGLVIDSIDAGTVQVTAEGRLENLLAHVAGLCRLYGLTCTVRQQGSQMMCRIQANRDRTGSVEFGSRDGTVKGRKVRSGRPTMTAGLAGGQGDLTARLFRQSETTPPPEWPRRIERFIDYSNADSTAMLDRKLAEDLAAGGPTASMELVPTEAFARQYRAAYDLGDTVGVVIDGVRTSQVVTAATISHREGKWSRTFVAGDITPTGAAAVGKATRSLSTRLRTLEGH